MAQEDFDYWFSSANRLFETFYFHLEKKYFSEAAFELHQVTERLYNGILLVFTRYKPKTHDLEDLRSLANSVDSRLVKAFSFGTFEERKLFKLLRKAYVDARYNPNFQVTEEELETLALRVQELKNIGEELCKEKINSFIG
ncbi:MAG: HEPN domain-containing protein [Taibaiella sp.]